MKCLACGKPIEGGLESMHSDYYHMDCALEEIMPPWERIKKDNALLIRYSDMVITTHSQVCQQAAFMKKPNIVFNAEDLFRTAEYGAGLHAANKTELVQAIRKVLNGWRPKCGRYTRDFAFRLDGKATERIASIIETMAEEHRLCR